MKNKKIFIACDTKSIKKVKKIIKETQTNKIKIGYKFGLEFFNSKNGRKFISKLKNKVIFIDLKLHDIPNTCVSTINSIKDDNKFEANSVKMLYSLPVNSYTLVNDKENKIYLVKLVSSKKNTFDETDENYLNFVNSQNTNTRKSILQSYDQLLNSKYQVQLNQKTIDRVKNYFK